jgi:hypothetical protein
MEPEPTKVTLVSRTKRTVTVRMPDGTERKIPGRDVAMVYCNKHDLDDAIANKPNRQTEIDCTLSDGGALLIFGTANYV